MRVACICYVRAPAARYMQLDISDRLHNETNMQGEHTLFNHWKLKWNMD